MADAPLLCMARIDQAELSGLATEGTDRERGRQLRLLLWRKGIDGDRLYRVEYYHHRRCWLLTQIAKPGRPVPSALPPPPGPADALFYVRALAELRQARRAAWRALAARSPYLRGLGCGYEPPAQPQVLTPAELADLLGRVDQGPSSVHFDSEGGWRDGPA